MTNAQLTRRIRLWLVFFIAGLVLSGLTAFPLRYELSTLVSVLGVSDVPQPNEPGLHAWLRTVHQGIEGTYARWPFMAYGTDWLAFGHLVIATAFLGAIRDPVRNKWLFTFGLVACAGVIPLALIAGQVRGIPLAWRLIDCSFGVFGAVPLLVCRHYLVRLERQIAAGTP
jgi:hypothetical protein